MSGVKGRDEDGDERVHGHLEGRIGLGRFRKTDSEVVMRLKEAFLRNTRVFLILLYLVYMLNYGGIHRCFTSLSFV